MWKNLFLSPMQAVTVVIATAAIYWVFVFLVRLLGQRVLARVSSTDLATAVALGAVLGRVALGYTPTFGAGVLALLTLFAMQAMAGQIEQRVHRPRVLDNPPILLMAGSELLVENLRKTHLVETEVWRALRVAGIRNREEVACVTLEPTGELSVLRRGAPLERTLVADVEGAGRLPADLFEGEG